MILRRNSADLTFEEIGGAESANLAGADQIRPAPTASPGSAFRRSGRIEIDVVGLEPQQARFAGPHEMQARCSNIVWAVVRPVREPVAITIVAPPDQRRTPNEIRGQISAL
jgi:hypothetical protein